jgi:alkylation response protein AidB-like acyl-CoA dehydrogenase
MRELASGGDRDTGPGLVDLARHYAGEVDGRIADPAVRSAISRIRMNARAFRLTQRRTVEESQGSTPGPATSIFKLYGANLIKERSEIQVSMAGSRGVGWDQTSFSADEYEMTRSWLGFKAHSIAGGSNEVQKNIIAKRVLGLPD